MEDRLAKVEQALKELQLENRQLRSDVKALRMAVRARESAAPHAGDHAIAPAEVVRQTRLRSRYSVAFLVLGLILVPLLAITVGHLNAFWSSVIGAINGIILYFVGPGAYHLLIEGLIRAIPGILLGQTARVTLDKMRNRRSRQP
ncbi:MAG TPA: hypothetical protein VGK74_05755 [Symbiobacteriaceae bacterium]